MPSFEAIRASLERRQRLVHGLELASWALLGSLGATVLMLVGGAVGIWKAVPFFAWMLGNLCIGAGAFVIGWLRPVNTVELLFRADRQLRSQERLVTLYELKLGYGPKEFLPLLERQLEQLPVNVAYALPLSLWVRRCWIVIALLAVVCLGMTSLVPLSSVFVHPETSRSQTASSDLESQRAFQLLEWLRTPSTELTHKLSSMRERLERARAALALDPSDPRARATLQHLHAELIQEQQRLAPPPPPIEEDQSKGSGPEASLVEGSPHELRSSQPRGSETQELAQLLQSLRSVSETAPHLSPEELQKLLEKLRETNPTAATLAEQLWQLTQNPEEFRERLEEILRELEARQALREHLEHLQRELESVLAQTEPPVGREGSPEDPLNTTTSREEGPSQARSEGQRSSASETHGVQSLESSEEGEPSAGTGRGTAPLDPEAISDLPDLSQWRERALPVPGARSEDLEILFEIVTMELPQDAESSLSPVLVQIDYAKVEALLDLFEIPEELRDAVRRYFLSLSNQP
ncbi:MAG: hypothetical protein NZ930_03100 [Candidatus Bipolaricaulota bacterium]|nr:hypothetical protein [Candidatus Bipolaricaulota bacterium]MDW8030726.1 hypothetical protein [Candidatus Bipolaricaulota bacterium]